MGKKKGLRTPSFLKKKKKDKKEKDENAGLILFFPYIADFELKFKKSSNFLSEAASMTLPGLCEETALSHLCVCTPPVSVCVCVCAQYAVFANTRTHTPML